MGSINKGSFKANNVSVNSKSNAKAYNQNASSKNKFNFADMHKKINNNFKVTKQQED